MMSNLFEDCGFYIYASDHVIRQPEDTFNGLAEQALGLLFDCDWSEVRRWGHGIRTRWTVMQRNSDGTPEVIVVEAFDGRLTITDNRRRP
jgi:hypothetical protein